MMKDANGDILTVGMDVMCCGDEWQVVSQQDNFGEVVIKSKDTGNTISRHTVSLIIIKPHSPAARLTKREAMAMAAMQGLMVNIGRNGLDIDKLDAVRDKAYEMADLMAEGQQSSTGYSLEEATGCSMEGLDKLTVRGSELIGGDHEGQY
jgi:hypothetical protein